MFRWLAGTVTLCVVAVVVGVLSAGLPMVEKVQDGVSPQRHFIGVAPQPPAAFPRLLVKADDAAEERVDDSLPISVVALAIVPQCQLSARDAQEVPSRKDGEILFIGAEVLPGERVADDDRIKAEMGFLAIELKQGEEQGVAASELVTRVKGKQTVQYRRYRDGDPIEPNTLVVLTEVRQFRRLKNGAAIKEGQLVGMINPDTALDDLSGAVAKLNGGEAKRAAAEKTWKEAKTRYERQEQLHRDHATSQEEVQGALLTYQRYVFEEIEDQQAISAARNDVSKALTSLKLHEIRARIPGVIKSIYKNNKGDAVKGLERGADTIMVIQNPAKLKIDGKVEIQYAHLFKPGTEVVVEPILRKSYEQAFRGHLQPITSVAVSNHKDKNNKCDLIVSASGENRVFVWDRNIEHQAKGVLNHPYKVLAVGCSPLNAKENLCLTGAEDGVGRIWNLEDVTAKNRKAIQVLRELRDGHQKPISCVAFSPKGDLCATGSDDSNVCVWETGSGKRLYTLTGHRGKVTSVQFASDNQLASAGNDHALILWDLKNDGKPVMKREGRGGEVTTLGVHPSGKQVLFDQGKELRLLSLPDGQYTGSLQNAAGATTFTAMALFSPDGNLILTNGTGEGRLQVWRTPTNRTRGYELNRLIWNNGATCGAFAPDGSFVVTGSKDSYVMIWPLPSREMIDKQLTARVISVDTSLEDSSNVMVHAEMINPNNLLFTEDKATLVVYPESK